MTTPDPDVIRDALRITCADAVELLTLFLDDVLSPDDHDRVQQHLAGCQACTVYLDQIRLTIQVCGASGEDDYTVDRETMDRLVELFRRRP
jgi:anti-sigma factor RsiW